MKPYSPRRRRFYSLLFTLLFILILPSAILYANGWRFVAGQGFVSTGGVFIDVPYPDASVLLDDVFVKRSGFLQRSFFLDNLAPASYTVRVEREGFRTWERTLRVEPEVVTDARVLLVPETIRILRVKIATSTTAGTSTFDVSRSAYNSYLARFATSTSVGSSTPRDTAGGLRLYIDRGILTARWTPESLPPAAFCFLPSSCVSEFQIGRAGVTDAKFWGGGVVYRTDNGTIFFTELDVRSSPVVLTLFDAPGATMRLEGNLLLIKSGGVLYVIKEF